MDQNSTAAGGRGTVMKRSGKAKEDYICIYLQMYNIY